jgi:hypothetical protein
MPPPPPTSGDAHYSAYDCSQNPNMRGGPSQTQTQPLQQQSMAQGEDTNRHLMLTSNPTHPALSTSLPSSAAWRRGTTRTFPQRLNLDCLPLTARQTTAPAATVTMGHHSLALPQVRP